MIQGENLQKVKTALNRTFNAIAGDLFEQCERMSREEVVEVVLDANYIDMYGGLEKPLLKEFQDLSYDERIKIATETFPFKYYSM